ncbi:hypothetical protein [Mastigocladopsis repens]|nr:hypothetical protein [Mastigocladopsis repens]
MTEPYQVSWGEEFENLAIHHPVPIKAKMEEKGISTEDSSVYLRVEYN